MFWASLGLKIINLQYIKHRFIAVYMQNCTSELNSELYKVTGDYIHSLLENFDRNQSLRLPYSWRASSSILSKELLKVHFMNYFHRISSLVFKLYEIHCAMVDRGAPLSLPIGVVFISLSFWLKLLFNWRIQRLKDRRHSIRYYHQVQSAFV